VAIRGMACARRRSAEESIVMEETVLRWGTQRSRVAVGNVEDLRDSVSRWLKVVLVDGVWDRDVRVARESSRRHVEFVPLVEEKGRLGQAAQSRRRTGAHGFLLL
jgi:hypothetical protein